MSKSLKTVTQLKLRGFVEFVWDGDVRLALVRVTSENLKRVDLSGCYNISAGGIDHILMYMSKSCSGTRRLT